MKITAKMALALCALLLVAASCATTSEKKKNDLYTFTDAPNVIFLTSFGTPDDLSPPSDFKKWIAGADDDELVPRLKRPYGVATAKNKVFVNDGRGSSGYWVIDLVKKEMNLVQHKQLAGSIGITVDDRGYKFLTVPILREARVNKILDTAEERGKILVFNEEDKFVKSAEFAGRPLGLAAYNDRLFVVDAVNCRIAILDKNSLAMIGELAKAPTGAADQIPRSVAIDQSGRIYVGHQFGGVKVFGQNGEFLSQYGYYGVNLGSFITTSGLTIDNAGHLYVVDSSAVLKPAQDEVQIFDTGRFYGKDEVMPSPETPLSERKNALLGYFQTPDAVGDRKDPNMFKSSIYKPLDIVIDYKNAEHFASYLPKAKIKYLIWLTSQSAHGGKNLAVFANTAE